MGVRVLEVMDTRAEMGEGEVMGMVGWEEDWGRHKLIDPRRRTRGT